MSHAQALQPLQPMQPMSAVAAAINREELAAKNRPGCSIRRPMSAWRRRASSACSTRPAAPVGSGYEGCPRAAACTALALTVRRFAPIWPVIR